MRAQRCPLVRPRSAGHLSAIDVGRQDGCRPLPQASDSHDRGGGPALGSRPQPQPGTIWALRGGTEGVVVACAKAVRSDRAHHVDDRT